MMTTIPKTKIDREYENVRFIDLMNPPYNLSVYEIMQETDYTPEEAYPEVAALLMTISMAMQIADRFGHEHQVVGMREKVTEIYSEWIEVSQGKLPISDIEKHPEAFQKAVEELNYRVGKQNGQ